MQKTSRDIMKNNDRQKKSPFLVFFPIHFLVQNIGEACCLLWWLWNKKSAQCCQGCFL